MIAIKYFVPALGIISIISFLLYFVYPAEIFLWIFLLSAFSSPFLYVINIKRRLKIYDNGIKRGFLNFTFSDQILAIYPFTLSKFNKGLKITKKLFKNRVNYGLNIYFIYDREEKVIPALKQMLGIKWDKVYKSSKSITSPGKVPNPFHNLEKALSPHLDIGSNSVDKSEKSRKYAYLNKITTFGIILLFGVILVSGIAYVMTEKNEYDAYYMKTTKIEKIENGTYVKIFGTVSSLDKEVLIVANPGSKKTEWKIKDFNLTDNTDSIQIIVEEKDTIYMGYHNYDRDYWSGDKMCVVGWVHITNETSYIDADIIANSPKGFPPRAFPYLIIGAVAGVCFLMGGIAWGYRKRSKSINE